MKVDRSQLKAYKGYKTALIHMQGNYVRDRRQLKAYD